MMSFVSFMGELRSSLSVCEVAFRSLVSFTGSVLWHGDKEVLNAAWNVYNPLILPDLDQDGTEDILLAHGGDDAFPHAVSADDFGLKKLYVVQVLSCHSRVYICCSMCKIVEMLRR